MKEFLIKVTRTIEFNTLVEAENEDAAQLEAAEHFYDFLLHTGYDGVDEFEIKQVKELDHAK